MVDLTNLKVGDTVHIDCGGSIVVPDNLHHDNVCTYFSTHMWHTVSGKYVYGTNSPFDIISITPKPEPKRIKGWANVYEDGSTVGTYSTKERAILDKIRTLNLFACIEIDAAAGEGL